MTHKPHGKGVAKPSVSTIQKPSGKGKKATGSSGTGSGGVGGDSGSRGIRRGGTRTRSGVRTRGGSVAVASEGRGKHTARSTAETEPSTPRGGVTSPLNGSGTPPTPGGAISQVGGTSGNGGRSEMSHNSSQNTASASVSRTRQPAQFPPATQPPISQQLTHRGPPPQAILQAPFEDEEEDHGDLPEDDLHVEGEEELLVPNPVGEDYQLLLDNLMHLPGREQLMHLSEHPIPNITTTW